MQSKMVRMVGSEDQKDRMVARGGRKTASFSEDYADTMANNCADCREDGGTVFGKVK